MDAAWVRDQLRSILQEDVYAPGSEGDQDFLEDFEQVVRQYSLLKERATLEKIRERERMLPDFNQPPPGGTFPWLDGIRRT